MRQLMVAVILALGFLSSSLQAAELSLVSGLYKSEKQKSDGEDAGGKSEITLGARYGDVLDAPFDWFVQPLLTMRSYDAPDGGKAPSDSTSLRLIGGVRWYFPAFSENFTPFLSGHAGYISDKDVSYADDGDATTAREVETSGLIYGGTAGFRLTLSKDFFFDIETQLFDSALFATTKTEPVDDDADGGDTETTRTELYVDTSGAFLDTTVGVGLKF